MYNTKKIIKKCLGKNKRFVGTLTLRKVNPNDDRAGRFILYKDDRSH